MFSTTGSWGCYLLGPMWWHVGPQQWIRSFGDPLLILIWGYDLVMASQRGHHVHLQTKRCPRTGAQQFSKLTDCQSPHLLEEAQKVIKTLQVGRRGVVAFVLLEENAWFLGTSDGAGGGEDLHIIFKMFFLLLLEHLWPRWYSVFQFFSDVFLDLHSVLRPLSEIVPFLVACGKYLDFPLNGLDGSWPAHKASQPT